MRKRENNGPLSVHAIAGSRVVLLGLDIDSDARRNLLGFALHRTDHNEDEAYWLKGFKTFEDTMPAIKPGTLVSTRDHPIQSFLWGDYTAKPGYKYTYKVVPVYGKPKNLEERDPVEVEVCTEQENVGEHAIFFNRGVAASQAYSAKFGNKKPDKVANPKEAFEWLSRGLEEAILGFISKANSPHYALRAAVYEFSYEPVLKALKDAASHGADVKIIYDARKGIEEPTATSEETIRKIGIKRLMIKREESKSYISHNKFIVLLKDDQPVEVWTGSTNFTKGGIFGQSNVGHLVRNTSTAKEYLDYWNRLAGDPKATELRTMNDQINPVPPDGSSGEIATIFSPRKSLEALEWYAKLLDRATNSACFTAAFGVNNTLADVFMTPKGYPRYLFLESAGKTEDQKGTVKGIMGTLHNHVAIGANISRDKMVIKDAMGFEVHRWLHENLTGFNTWVNYVHTKYMLIDPLSNDPITISGSANFSDASTKNNDENMLVIWKNTRVADIYLGEFMRLFNHYYFRYVANNSTYAAGSAEKSSTFITPDDSWIDRYFEKGSVDQKKRFLFR